MKLKSVLIGTSGWGEAHIKAYQQSKHVELVGLCGNRNKEILNQLADKYSIPNRSLDLRSMLHTLQPDMLDVACNPHYRLEAVKAAAEAGSVRIINLEKPIALRPQEVTEIVRICESHRMLLTVNHQKKYLPAWNQAKKWIDAGKIGDIDFIRGTCQGNLLEQGTHMMDMVLYFTDYQPIDWVMGYVDALEGLDKTDTSAPDAAMATVVFQNQSRALLEIGSNGRTIPNETNKWFQFGVEIYGSKGWIKVSLNQQLELFTYERNEWIKEPSNWDAHYLNALIQHLDDVALYAQDPGRGHISEISRSMLSFEIMMAIMASGSGKGKIQFPWVVEPDIIDNLESLRRSKPK
jgi:predicted dehydrogenase